MLQGSAGCSLLKGLLGWWLLYQIQLNEMVLILFFTWEFIQRATCTVYEKLLDLHLPLKSHHQRVPVRGSRRAQSADLAAVVVARRKSRKWEYDADNRSRCRIPG